MRPKRRYEKGYPQHIVNRGNNRQACFLDSQDYRMFLTVLKECAQEHRVPIHAFVLMTNHFHLLATPPQANSLSKLMQSLGRQYVRYFNDRHGRSGSLWEDRYKAAIVNTDSYLLAVYRYIELNPLRANMVKELHRYPWSSYQRNGLGKKITFLTPHDVYLSLGATDELRRSRYQNLINEALTAKEEDTIRRGTQTTQIIGDDHFLQKLT